MMQSDIVNAMATKKATTPKNKENEKTDAKATIAPAESQRFRDLNLWLALAFGVQAIAVVLFGGAKSVPITAQYLSVDQLASQAAGHQVLGVATRHLFDLRLTVVAAAFLAVFALVNVLVATVCRPRYEKLLAGGTNLARWLGFGLAGGLMVVAIALESGVYELAALVSLFAFMVLGASLEPLAEKLKHENKGLLPHAVCGAALVAGALPWVVFALGVLGALLWDGHIPGSVYMMYLTTLALFGCWVLAAHFRVTRRGRWTDTLYAEKMYLFLSFVTASVLAWQIFAGAL